MCACCLQLLDGKRTDSRLSQGSLDIMVQRSGSSGSARNIVFIKNNYFHDAFFLKALGGLIHGLRCLRLLIAVLSPERRVPWVV